MASNQEAQDDTFVAERTKLGERLREAREYLALSQDEVARAVGIPRAAISLIESGQRRVGALELKKLAAVYQQSVGSLSGEEMGRSDLPTDVEHVARAAKRLSSKDREELVRFAEFLHSRAAEDRKR